MSKTTSRQIRRSLLSIPPSDDSEGRIEILFDFDYAPAHRAIVTQQCIQQTCFTHLPHPPYSPDIAICNIYGGAHHTVARNSIKTVKTISIDLIYQCG
ncbi:hypothetical protein BLNAU_12936 [Blattamonas nauphoetae]|uniref:Transposase n=1 Tax=Blattamonas nauphoetae TaxID=2049346 RepID=A0ABQ9XKT3_9EUKA|nr:hypothetical protein BLNAU_12936 [Blattamonas nauphoetae]